MFTRDTFSNFNLNANNALLWLRDICGEEKVNRSRFSKYLQSLNTRINLKDVTKATAEIVESFAIAFDELSYLIAIHSGFSRYEDIQNLERCLDLMLDGSFSRTDDKSSGRDFALELSIGAKLLASGLDIRLGAQSGSDIELEYKDSVICIECKRPKTFQSLERNIAKANRQIRKRCHKRSDKIGLVALNSSLIINPNYGFLEIESEQKIQPVIDNYHNKFMYEVGYFINKLRSQNRLSKRNQGTISEFNSLVILKNEELETTTNDIIIVPNWGPGGLIFDLGPALEKGKV